MLSRGAKWVQIPPPPPQFKAPNALVKQDVRGLCCFTIADLWLDVPPCLLLRGLLYPGAGRGFGVCEDCVWSSRPIRSLSVRVIKL